MSKWIGAAFIIVFVFIFSIFSNNIRGFLGSQSITSATTSATAATIAPTPADAGLCKTTLECAQQAVSAALAAQAAAEKMSSNFDQFTKTPPAQVGMLSCHKQFAVNGGTQIDVIFTSADCQNVRPTQGWTYTASLIGTDICGGFTEYEISPDPFNPVIRFFGNFHSGCTSSATVQWIGFSPRAF